MSLPFKDETSAIAAKRQMRDLSQDCHYTTTCVYQRKIVRRPQAQRNQPYNRKSTMRCLLFCVWSVWFRLRRLYSSTPSTCCWTWKLCDRWTLFGCPRGCRPPQGRPFTHSKKVPRKIWLFCLWDPFHRAAQSLSQHANWFHSRKTLCFKEYSITYCLFSIYTFFFIFHSLTW